MGTLLLMALLSDPLDPLRRRVAGALRQTVTGSTEPRPVADLDDDDLGWFGPGSAAWRVHADVGAMMIGGFSSLFLQTLHPGAMAGVDQYSNWREDPVGRLQRTANFIGVTTFGRSTEAEDIVAVVRRIHRGVEGRRHDGLPYRADDPDLLRWVHVAEVWQFLRAYQRYSGHPLSRPDRDRYLDEVAVVAEALGATDVPRSVRQVERYLTDVQPELVATEAALVTVADLLRPVRDPVERAGREVIMRAAIGMLPDWARQDARPAVPLPLRRPRDPGRGHRRRRARSAGRSVSPTCRRRRRKLPPRFPAHARSRRHWSGRRPRHPAATRRRRGRGPPRPPQGQRPVERGARPAAGDRRGARRRARRRGGGHRR